MRMYKMAFLLAVLFTSLTGCGKQENDFVSQSLQEVVDPGSFPSGNQSKPFSATHANESIPVLPKPPVGIIIEDGRIIIDAKQTQTFLESLAKKLDNQFKKIEHDLRKEQIRSPKESGIVVTPNRIEIDLNKTEKFMEKWIRSMEHIGQELDTVFRELDQSLSPQNRKK